MATRGFANSRRRFIKSSLGLTALACVPYTFTANAQENAAPRSPNERVEEIFPLKCSIEEADAFIAGSKKHADGWISFYWGKTIEENEQAGDLKGAIVAAWLRYFQSHSPLLSDSTDKP